MNLKFNLNTLMVGQKQATVKVLEKLSRNEGPFDADWIQFKMGELQHVFIQVTDEDNPSFLKYIKFDGSQNEQKLSIPVRDNELGSNARARLSEIENDLADLAKEIKCIRNND